MMLLLIFLLREILRDEGISLVQKFDGEYPERWSKEIFKYLSINKEEFPEAYDSFESSRIL